MENETQNKSAASENLAKVLNLGGKALVTAYDATVSTFSKIFSTVKREVPVISEKTKGIFTKGFTFLKSSETSELETKIKEYEKQIKDLYFEIGREGSKVSQGESPVELEAVKKLVIDVRNYEKEIERLQKRIIEVKEEKEAEDLRKKEEKKAQKLAKLAEKSKRNKNKDEEIRKLIESNINKALKIGEFESLSEQEIFGKVARDLLDTEIEIQCLAAAELGKMKNAAAVPVLMEAVKFEHPELIAEIINSLIAIGDPSAVPLFEAQIKSPKYTVRVGCLRGIYKLGDNETAMSILTEALRDDHPEVRRNALTFIGWKDYTSAVSSVIQCLKDEEPRVRKAAISTLANLKDESSVLPLISTLGDKDIETREKAFDALKSITREEIKIDVHASDKDLEKSIINLKDWWQKERIENVSTPEFTQAVPEVTKIVEPEVTQPEPEIAPVEPEKAIEPEITQQVIDEPVQVEPEVTKIVEPEVAQPEPEIAPVEPEKAIEPEVNQVTIEPTQVEAEKAMESESNGEPV
ncbi:MAG: HEAT repeat domain-containing protein [Desulfobacterales bacterium]|nr:HEAT repeat domain-containing protein [Desulfobacterales bacterium]